MRTSDYFLITSRETPKEAEVVSHQLMLRAGMIRKLASGLYTWMPMGLKVLRKVSQIIREEMDRAGALECLMPAVQPAELWQESGRWDEYGEQLLKMLDQNNREFCFGPTHEEVITDIARKDIRSYKQLPVIFYQIQNKFRDEIRPRFGVMRAREFLMKDAYSFDLDQKGLEQSYDRMYKAYCNIFDRIGLQYRPVEADVGAIGGNKSQEFQVLADTGEDLIFYSDEGEYAANIELAQAIPDTEKREADGDLMEKVDTGSNHTIEAVSKCLNVPPNKMIKTLIVKGVEEPFVALLLRGDHALNQFKAEKHPKIAAPLQMANDEDIVKATGCAPGVIGPVNLKLPIIADHSATMLNNFACGANEQNTHLINVAWKRDLPLPESFDLRNVVVGDRSPRGGGHLQVCRGIEVGHIFQLGQKYSKSMHAQALDDKGERKTLHMGCYGIGVSRIVAASIEQNHDDNGIIWPDAIAPFQLALVPINISKSQRLREAAENLYQQLLDAGYDILFDDRDERPGVLFSDMDLIGIPHRIVISERGLDAGTLEYKGRRDAENQNIPQTELMTFLGNVINSQ